MVAALAGRQPRCAHRRARSHRCRRRGRPAVAPRTSSARHAARHPLRDQRARVAPLLPRRRASRRFFDRPRRPRDRRPRPWRIRRRPAEPARKRDAVPLEDDARGHATSQLARRAPIDARRTGRARPSRQPSSARATSERDATCRRRRTPSCSRSPVRRSARATPPSTGQHFDSGNSSAPGSDTARNWPTLCSGPPSAPGSESARHERPSTQDSSPANGTHDRFPGLAQALAKSRRPQRPSGSTTPESPCSTLAAVTMRALWCGDVTVSRERDGFTRTARADQPKRARPR